MFYAFFYGVSLACDEFNVESPQIVIAEEFRNIENHSPDIGYIVNDEEIAIPRDFLLDLLIPKNIYVSGSLNGKLIIVTRNPTMHVLGYGIQETIHHAQKLSGWLFSDNAKVKWENRLEEVDAFYKTKLIVEKNAYLRNRMSFLADIKNNQKS